jgi:hypothetical protein
MISDNRSTDNTFVYSYTPFFATNFTCEYMDKFNTFNWNQYNYNLRLWQNYYSIYMPACSVISDKNGNNSLTYGNY